MTRLSHEEVEAIRKRHTDAEEEFFTEHRLGPRVIKIISPGSDDFDAAHDDRAALLADRDAMMEGTVDEIAAIVCKHVPPVRFCDRGATCPCWAEYAVPAAKAILARFQLVQVPPSSDVV